MSLNLIEAEKIASTDQNAALVRELQESGLILAMPFVDAIGGLRKYSRNLRLPQAGYRAAYEKYGRGTSEYSVEAEGVYDFGLEIDVDAQVVEVTGGVRARAEQEMDLMSSIRLDYERSIIKGDSASSGGREFDGLQKRIPRDSSQFVDNGGGGLILEKLLETVDAVDARGGNRTWICNKQVRRALTLGIHDPNVSGYVTRGQDELGRPIPLLCDIPLIVVDKDSQNNDILPFSELGDTTSMYLVSWGPNLAAGLKSEGELISAEDIGKLQDAPVYRTRVTFYSGLFTPNPRAIARLGNIGKGAFSLRAGS